MADIEMNREDTFGDIIFLYEVPTRLLCALCNNAAKEPWIHVKCDKLFCRSCVTKTKEDVEICPHCKEKNAEYYTDIKSESKLNFILRSEQFSITV